MHIDHPNDPRPAVFRRLAEVVEDLEREAPPRVVLAALIDLAQRRALRLEGDDPKPGRVHGRVSS